MQSIKISDEAYNFLKQISDTTGKSIRELVEQAINIAFKNANIERDVVNFKQALITVRFGSKYSICGKEIRTGELALWIKYEYADKSISSRLVCLECYYNDKTIAKMYLKRKELEQTIRGLRKIADSLAEEVRKLQSEVDVYTLRKRIKELYNDVRTYLQTGDNDKLIDIIDRLERLEEDVSKLKERHVITKSPQKLKTKDIF